MNLEIFAVDEERMNFLASWAEGFWSERLSET